MAGAVLGPDQALRLKQVVRLEHGGRAYVAAGARLPDGRQLVTGLESALLDGGDDVGREGFVTFHARPLGQTQLIWFFAPKLIREKLFRRA
jgi:hypothetical protein